MTSFYKIPFSLHHSQKGVVPLSELLESLETLDAVCDDAFSRIRTRVGVYQDRLSVLNKRIDLAQNLVEQTKGSSKATRVLSSAKYPAPTLLNLYVTPFSTEGASLANNNNNNNSYNNNINISDNDNSNNVNNNNNNTVKKKRNKRNRKLQQLNNNGYQPSILGNVSDELYSAKNFTNVEGEGLGRLPPDLSTISSLLLFNTSENLYKKYVVLDPLGGGVVKANRGKEDQPSDMDAAPASIINRDEMELLVSDSFIYHPTFGDVPDIDAPDILPNLPGIAEIEFSADPELLPSIAPSLGMNFQLPDFSQENEVTPAVPSLPDIDTVESISSTEIEPQIIPQQTKSVSVVPPPTAPIPPPPPPPAATPSAINTKAYKPDQSRGNLLESIRTAGKLKKVADRPPPKKSEKVAKAATQAAPLDMMSALRQHLERRRTVMGGQQQQRKESSTSIDTLDNNDTDFSD